MLQHLFDRLYKKRVHGLEDIPGPDPSFPMGTAADFLVKQKPWEVCAGYARKYGGLTRIWLMGKPALVLNDAELIGQVLEKDWKHFYKKAPCNELEPVITKGSLFITNPPEWHKAREANPLTQVNLDTWLEGLIAPLTDVITQGLREFSKASSQGPIDLYTEMQRLTFQAFGKAFWGQTFDDKVFDWFESMASTGDLRMKAQLGRVPALNPFFHVEKDKWYRKFGRLVRQARSSNDNGQPDLLSVQKRNTMDDAGMAEALATNFFGGVFSGSSTINSLLYLLAKNPEEKTKLQTAISNELSQDKLDMSALMSCRQLDFTLREAMRYYPAVPLYFRNSLPTSVVALGSHHLPPDTQLFISNWYLHKYSNHWTEPEKFMPDRWANGVAEQNPIGSGYFFPFGRGPRMCIGTHFAMFYLKLALAILIRDSDIDLDPEQSYDQSFFFGVMMPKGLRARFKAA